jgi:diguanylate cyclase (GGDEF)-like protein
MRKLSAFLLLLLFLSLAPAAPCQNRAPLTHIRDIKYLSNAEAARDLPVQVEATVTYVRPSENNLFVMEDGLGLYIQLGSGLDPEAGLIAGDRIAITGVTNASFRPMVVASQIHFLAHGVLPPPQHAEFDQLIRSEFDCQYVQISGHILSAALDDSRPNPKLRLRIKLPGGTVDGIIVHPGELLPEALLDADVSLAGVAAATFDSKMQEGGISLDMNSWKDLTYIRRASSDSWSIPLTPMDHVIDHYWSGNQSQRVRITGTLTYFEPGALAVVEQSGRSMLVKTDSTLPLHAGAAVEATGFPTIDDENVRLEDGQLRAAAQATPFPPTTIDWERASTGANANDLVAMEGEVVGLVHDSRVDLFIIDSGGHLFSATLRHSSSDAASTLSYAATPTLGSRVRVIGVCFTDFGNHWRDRFWFDIRMRSLADVVVLQQPSWWTVRRLAYVITLLSAIILIFVIWAGLLDRQLRKQTAISARQSQEDAIRERRLARQEQQRSHILELISSSAPLPKVLQEIQTMVSSRLYGAPCRFELSASLGEGARPERPVDPAIVCEELLSRDGATLGLLLATPLRHISSEAEISAAMAAGARLAELAIDTRRLYSDLRHRSEHDLLTDIPNRFSMEKRLDQLMQSARRSEAVFGMIYVDLDRFKQVNDQYGHRIGDLYLQEVTRRMKLQLRSGDMLTRIGGDEFLALVPILSSRADAEEIALRLERCFDEPFDLEGIQLQGSASVGLAIYPADGATEEELQRSADAAMYVHKESKRK